MSRSSRDVGSSRGGSLLQLEGSDGSPRRGSVNKRKAGKAFNGESARTDRRNVVGAPMRGGIRL